MLVGRRKPLTAAQQFINLRGNPICRGEGELRAGRIIWRYTATPFPLGRDYAIRVEFGPDHQPRVLVESPDLHELAGGREIPHMYQQKKLCLYLPRTYEWQRWMRLDQTIVPWTSLWLFYFEEWLASDDWKGGGMHPGDDDGREEAA